MTVLVDSRTGNDIKIGSVVQTFRGEKYILEGFYSKGRGSSGRVVLRKGSSARTEEYFPAVIGAAIVEEKD